MLFMEKKEALKELTRDAHMPSFCAEEGYCEALDDCAADVGIKHAGIVVHLHDARESEFFLIGA